MKLSKVILTALAAVIVLSVIVAPATARNRVEVSTTAFLASGTHIFTSSAGNVTCDITFHITARRLISKVEGSEIGQITAVLTNNIRHSGERSGECTPLPGMSLAYGGITGTLPTITGGTTRVNSRFRVEIDGLSCLVEPSIPVIAVENPVGRGTIGENSSTCAIFVRGRVSGTVSYTPAFTIRLLETR